MFYFQTWVQREQWIKNVEHIGEMICRYVEKEGFILPELSAKYIKTSSSFGYCLFGLSFFSNLSLFLYSKRTCQMVGVPLEIMMKGMQWARFDILEDLTILRAQIYHDDPLHENKTFAHCYLRRISSYCKDDLDIFDEETMLMLEDFMLHGSSILLFHESFPSLLKNILEDEAYKVRDLLLKDPLNALSWRALYLSRWQNPTPDKIYLYSYDDLKVEESLQPLIGLLLAFYPFSESWETPFSLPKLKKFLKADGAWSLFLKHWLKNDWEKSLENWLSLGIHLGIFYQTASRALFGSTSLGLKVIEPFASYFENVQSYPLKEEYSLEEFETSQDAFKENRNILPQAV